MSSSSWSSSSLSLPILSVSNLRPFPSASPEGRAVPGIDLISQIPDELLQKILSKVSLKEAVSTSILSRRWVDLWKHRLDFCVDMGSIMRAYPPDRVHEASRRFAESMTQTINNHQGSLKTCQIRHLTYQCEDGTLESWIRTMIQVKHTKELILLNLGPSDEYTIFLLDPTTFSHHSLSSLSLSRYKLTLTNDFSSCCNNLKTLKICYTIANVNVLNKVLKACSSLEVLVLQMLSLKGRGSLEIKNKNLEILQVVYVTRLIKVNAPCLEILDIRFASSGIPNLILDAAKVQYTRHLWVSSGYRHISCNIPNLTQEKKNIWLDLMRSQSCFWRRTGSLSVNIDAKNPKEVEILKRILLLWGEEMLDLELLFMNNDALSEEGDSSTHKKWWDDDKPYPNASFRVNMIWMHNFSGSNEEFALASRFVTQGVVTEKLMIETVTYPLMKRLKIEEQVAKLKKLFNTSNDRFTIDLFESI